MVEADFTLVGVNPALEQFKDLAQELREEAEQQARRSGRQLGAAIAGAVPIQAGASRDPIRFEGEAA